jgi:hypothetical protein
LNIGITGHQTLMPGQRWDWAEEQLYSILAPRAPSATAWSSLAPGADQRFAVVAERLDIPLHVVVPFAGYEHHLPPKDRLEFDRLLRAAAAVETLRSASDTLDTEQLYSAAGRYVIDHVDLVLAIYDKVHHRGRGGTGDMVDYARSIGRSVFVIDPRIECVILP